MWKVEEYYSIICLSKSYFISGLKMSTLFLSPFPNNNTVSYHADIFHSHLEIFSSQLLYFNTSSSTVDAQVSVWLAVHILDLLT